MWSNRLLNWLGLISTEKKKKKKTSQTVTVDKDDCAFCIYRMPTWVRKTEGCDNNLYRKYHSPKDYKYA